MKEPKRANNRKAERLVEAKHPTEQVITPTAQATGRRVVVVLGMHRSGTSAITRALSVLGVSLGDNLLPAQLDNPTGFWEDKEIMDLNEEILRQAGLSWHSLTIIDDSFWLQPSLAELKQEAIQLVRSRLADYRIWGFKDPRTCRLLPFWQEILAHLAVEVGYVIIIRNPLSVARSLKVRNGFPPEKSYLLWLTHTIPAVCSTEKKPRLVIDYDRLMENPACEIARLATGLHFELRDQGSDISLADFTNNFLDNHLRHSLWRSEDLMIDPKIYQPIRDTYSLLTQVATDQLSVDASDFIKQMRQIKRNLLALSSLYSYCDQLDVQLGEAETHVQRLATESSVLQTEIAERDAQIVTLNQAIAERDAHANNLQDKLTKSKTEAHNREIQFQELQEQWVAEKNRTQELELHLSDQAAQLAALLRSTSWRITAPMRMLKTGALRLRPIIGRKVRDLYLAVPLPIETKLKIKSSIFTALSPILKRTASYQAWLAFEASRSGSNIGPVIPQGNVLAVQSSDDPWWKPLGEKSWQTLGNRILIIAELSMSQCTKYRVEQKKEMLSLLGYDCTVMPWQNAPQCRRALQTHGMVIFYRTPAFPSMIELIEETRRIGMISFFDIDDLIFDIEEYSRNTNVQRLSKSERSLLLNGARFYNRMATLTDHAIASTPVIAEHLKRLCRGDVFLLENALDSHLLELAAELKPSPSRNYVVIGYGSGTKTHDTDFLAATEAVVQILDCYPNVRLAIYGHLQLPDSLDRHADRIICVPFLDQDDYYLSLARFDISIAPLEDTVFNDAKSNIKFLEASVFGIPSVCSPAAAFRQVIRQGENGFLANSPSEWFDALAHLIEQPALRERIGSTARKDILEHLHTSVVAQRQVQPIVRRGLRHTLQLSPDSDRPLRILLVNILFSPTSFGGATIVAEQLALGLNARPDIEVIVFAGTFSESIQPYDLARYEWREIPVFVTRLPSSDKREQDYDNPDMKVCFTEVLKAVRPDIVHFHSVQMLSATLAHACRDQGVPYVITLHDAWWICERQFMVKADGVYCGQAGVDTMRCANCVSDPAFTHRRFRWLWKVLNDATLLLAPSEFQRQLYINTGIRPKRIAVNRNGICAPAPAFHKRRGRPITLAYLGGQAIHKGFFWLQQIFEGIPETDYVLKIVDVERKVISNTSRINWKIGGRLEVVEPFDQGSLDEFYGNIDILLFPSLWKESFGLTVREAMVRDIWIIATDCGGPAEEIVPGINGDIVPMGDTEAFRAAVRRFLSEPHKLENYINPHKSQIRLVSEQVDELAGFLREASACCTNPHALNRFPVREASAEF